MSGQDSDRRQTYSRSFQAFSLFLGLVVLVLIPLTRLVFPIMVKGERFPEAISLMPMFYFATMLSSIAGFLGSIFGAERKTRYIFSSTVIGGVTNIVLLHLLMPVMGISAAPLCLWIGFAIVNVMRLIWLHKREVLAFKWSWFAIYCLAFLAVTAVYMFGNMVHLIACLILVSAVSLKLLWPLFSQVHAAFSHRKRQ
ncbi:MAG TPA: hypothetical protein GX717_00080 [Clostridiaceae bacterium]|nr:hypothetical protein [Clostridiaceae bacterium]